MRSTYKIIWSSEAYLGLQEIIEYLEDTFTEKEVKAFIQAFDDQINRIALNPKTFKLSSKSKILRIAFVNKLTSIYYTIEGSQVRLVAIRDNRKRPI